MAESPKEVESDKLDGYDKWEIENNARTLIEAEQIRSDPKKCKVVEKEIQRQRDAAAAALTRKQVEDRAGARLKKTYGD